MGKLAASRLVVSGFDEVRRVFPFRARFLLILSRCFCVKFTLLLPDMATHLPRDGESALIKLTIHTPRLFSFDAHIYATLRWHTSFHYAATDAEFGFGQSQYALDARC